MNEGSGMAVEWLPVETLPPLGEGEVQLWRVDLPDADALREEFIDLLSADERARAGRLRAGKVRLQFVVARAVLRTLLGHCLALNPKEVPITTTSFGKPETPGVYFNVAHSGAAILIALCRSHGVGIDIEFFSREVDPMEIARHSFSIKEQRALSSIADPNALRRAFFRCWTRKEAVIKADGRGLSLALDSFEVPMEERAACAAVVVAAGEQMAGQTYYVTDIGYGGEAAAALAIAASHFPVRKFVFPLAEMAQKG